MERRASRWRQNALRSGVVVIGAVAFGYLSFQLIFKPYLERAQEISQLPGSVTHEPDRLVEEEPNHYYKEDEVID